MKTKIILSLVAIVLIATTNGQKPTLELTFTAIDDTSYVQLDSIMVMNRTRGGGVVAYWPDTTLTVTLTLGDLLLCIGYSTGFPVGLQEIHFKTPEFTLFQNYPNPVKDQSVISMYIPENGIVNVMVYVWTLPFGATIASGSGTNAVILSFANNAYPGNITVYGNNLCGNGTISPAI